MQQYANEVINFWARRGSGIKCLCTGPFSRPEIRGRADKKMGIYGRTIITSVLASWMQEAESKLLQCHFPTPRMRCRTWSSCSYNGELISLLYWRVRLGTGSCGFMRIRTICSRTSQKRRGHDGRGGGGEKKLLIDCGLALAATYMYAK